MQQYDYIIAGGGCAGLSLAYRLCQAGLDDKKVLLLDTQPKVRNDKTWCFWGDRPVDFKCASKISWGEMEFCTSDGIMRESLGDLRYYYVKSLDFYQEVQEEIFAHPNVTVKYERVTSVTDEGGHAQVTTQDGTYTGEYVFNSIVERPELKPENYFYLKQHFCGWVVRTEEATFDPKAIRMMDFSIDQEEQGRFVYILPFSETEALVEFTIFSEHLLSDEAYRKELVQYMDHSLKVDAYEIVEEERGVIPMTNHPFPRYTGNRVVNLGTAGGFTKPTTGYTFKSIQEDIDNIVAALKETGKPFYRLQKSRRFSFYDDLLLFIIQNQGELLRPIFSRLFRRNRFHRILTFLEEKTTIRQELWILLRLPWKPFLNAILQYYIKGQTRWVPGYKRQRQKVGAALPPGKLKPARPQL
ncbi:MAG: lycopene cyclase family protein [Bacteroidota bacterium]